MKPQIGVGFFTVSVSGVACRGFNNATGDIYTTAFRLGSTGRIDPSI
jgi:hypothetical protein